MNALAVFLIILSGAVSALSPNTSASCSWTANTATTGLTNATGYKLYWGTESGVYPNVQDAGLATTATISGLTNGTYYAVVTAYNSAGTESPLSNEISVVIGPTPTPTASPTASPTATPSTKFKLGQSVAVNSGGCNVRQTAAGTLLGTQPAGTIGLVTAGPQLAILEGTSAYWWTIKFSSGVSGWVGEAVITVTVPPTPTPTPIPTYTKWLTRLTAELKTGPTTQQILTWETANPPVAD